MTGAYMTHSMPKPRQTKKTRNHLRLRFFFGCAYPLLRPPQNAGVGLRKPRPPLGVNGNGITIITGLFNPRLAIPCIGLSVHTDDIDLALVISGDVLGLAGHFFIAIPDGATFTKQPDHAL